MKKQKKKNIPDQSFLDALRETEKSLIKWKNFFPTNISRHVELGKVVSVVNTLIIDGDYKTADTIIGLIDFYTFLKENKRDTFDQVIRDIKIIKQFERYYLDEDQKYEDTIHKVAREFQYSIDNIERIIKSYRKFKKRKTLSN